MNWRLILQLSALGLVMGLAIVFLLPPGFTPWLWMVIAILSAYAIAKRCLRRRFLHGLLVGTFDWLLNVGTHVIFFHDYAVRHATFIALLQEIAPTISVRQLIEVAAPAIGAALGFVIGLAAILFGVFLDRARRDAMTA